MANEQTGIISGARANVADWYRNTLGRDPDQAGQQFWQSAIDNGGDPNRIYNDFTAAAVRNGESLRIPGATNSTPQTPNPAAPATPAPTASTYQAAQLGTPTAWNITPDQTVEGRINNLVDPNSPIIQSARTRALEQQNANGTLNSSMAISAADRAAYDVALPIAQTDAATASKAAGYNADERNQFDVQNMNALNQAGQFNAGAQNTLTGQKLAADTSIATANIGANAQLSSARISADTQRTIAALDSTTRSNLAQLDATTKTNLAQLDSSTRTQLANIDAQYHTLMQSNASASDLFRQITQNITNISMSKDMDAAAKQQAVNNQLNMLQNGMTINGTIANLNLGSLLNFSESQTTPTPPAATEPAEPSFTSQTFPNTPYSAGGV